MQEVTSVKETATTPFDLLRTSALVDTSSKSRAFGDFMGLMSQTSGASTQAQATQTTGALDLVTTLPTVQVETTTPVATSTVVNPTTVTAVSQTRQTVADANTSVAKNTPVSREAFEESKPLLLKAGLTESEISDLDARVKAGTLTWGQLVQGLGTHMTGAKKAVALSATETADLQSLFQKLGFAGDVASQMVQSMANGDGLKVLSAIQNKLSTMDNSSSLGINKDELSTFFKALKLPQDTATKLSTLLGGENTVADMKNALAAMSQSLQDQHAKSSASDTELAKSLGKIMDKDVAKNARDTSQTTSQTTSDSANGLVSYELKTKDKDDTSWFTQHEKNQQKSSDDAWRNFVAKVRSTDSGTQQNLADSAQASKASGRDALETLAARTSSQSQGAQQAKAETTPQTKAYEKVAAPKILNQVSEALLKDLGQGRKQLTIQLDPENLGKVQVMLQVKGKEVSAVLTAEDAGTAAMLTANMDSIKKTLQDQGLTVQSMEVQTGLASNQQQADFSADQHNQAQQQQDMSQIFSQLRMLRADFGDVASDMQNSGIQAILADQGLHIIA